VNRSSQTLYIGLRRVNGRLEIHIYRQPDPERIEVRPMQRVSVDAIPDVDACIVNRKLQYSIVGHDANVELRPPTTSKPDGPVFRFYDRSP
jgi:hypothetical protein